MTFQRQVGTEGQRKKKKNRRYLLAAVKMISPRVATLIMNVPHDDDKNINTAGKDI